MEAVDGLEIAEGKVRTGIKRKNFINVLTIPQLEIDNVCAVYRYLVRERANEADYSTILIY